MKLLTCTTACLVVACGAFALSCAKEEPKTPTQQTAQAVVEESKQTPVNQDVTRYARALCDPLSDFLSKVVSVQEVMGQETPEQEVDFGQALAVMTQLKQPVRDLAGGMRDIKDVPEDVQPWHRGMLAGLEYLDGVITLVESGGLFAALAAGPTPEPAPAPPPELLAAIGQECGEELVAQLRDWDEEATGGGEVPSETALPNAEGTPSPRATATSSPVGASRANTVPRGQSLVTPAGFEITVVGVDFDAWPLIQAENSFNNPPAPGNVMVLIGMRATYVGTKEETASISESDFKLTGSLNRVYSPYDEASSCGVIPDELQAELFSGGATEGNVCFQVPASETGLILIAEPMFTFGENERRFFALN